MQSELSSKAMSQMQGCASSVVAAVVLRTSYHGFCPDGSAVLGLLSVPLWAYLFAQDSGGSLV